MTLAIHPTGKGNVTLTHLAWRVLETGSYLVVSPVKAVVEAGEMFQLSGLEPRMVGALMADCLQRNLRRVEMAQDLSRPSFAPADPHNGQAIGKEALVEPTENLLKVVGLSSRRGKLLAPSLPAEMLGPKPIMARQGSTTTLSSEK